MASYRMTVAGLFVVAVCLSASACNRTNSQPLPTSIPASQAGNGKPDQAVKELKDVEFDAAQRQAASAKELNAEVEITNSIGMKLRLIPAGEFLMGSPESDKDAIARTEMPQHQVRITKPFYLGKFEVTQGQWKAVMSSEPWIRPQQEGIGYLHIKQGDDYPATHVTWDETVEFCRKLSEKEGKMYRLPTEAELEYACRSGTTTRFHFGNGDNETELGEYAWYEGNAQKIVDEAHAHTVGLKKSNAFGLYDMHGNVYEWCSDRFDRPEDENAPGYYAKSPTNDPQGPETGNARVSRSGSWQTSPGYCRAASKVIDIPSSHLLDLGFRICRVF